MCNPSFFTLRKGKTKQSSVWPKKGPCFSFFSPHLSAEGKPANISVYMKSMPLTTRELWHFMDVSHFRKIKSQYIIIGSINLIYREISASLKKLEWFRLCFDIFVSRLSSADRLWTKTISRLRRNAVRRSKKRSSATGLELRHCLVKFLGKLRAD